MRILILGGTGFIGPHVARQLAVLGHQVTVAHTGEHEAELPAEVEHLHSPLLSRADRPDLGPLRAEFARRAPDVVVDMFPLTEPDARVVVNAFRGTARRTVAVSSQDVYRVFGRLWRSEPGPPDPVPLTEDAPLREKLCTLRGETPRSPDDPDRWRDDYEKILVERVFMGDPDLPGTVLRLPMVYGPNDGHRLFHQSHVKRLLDGRPVVFLDEAYARWRAPWGYVENVAAAIALAAVDERAAGRVYNVAEPDAPTQADWIRYVGEAAGWRGEIIALPKERLPEYLRWDLDTEQQWVVDSSRIRRELGYGEQVPRDEALRRTVAWERANPPDQIDPAKFDYATEDALFGEVRRAS